MKRKLGFVILFCLLSISGLTFSEEDNSADWYKKSPLGAGILADLIREGDIAIGNEYTIEVGGRFHRIHAKFMAINCESCHAEVRFPKDLQFLRRDEYPIEAYPGAVDRGICLGCHRGEGALAAPFYKGKVKTK